MPVHPRVLVSDLYLMAVTAKVCVLPAVLTGSAAPATAAGAGGMVMY